MKKPISESKLLANRDNALKSTGPRTPEGKARSSRNALTHGLTASFSGPVDGLSRLGRGKPPEAGLTAQDLTALGEDLHLLPSLVEHFTASWNPQSPYEHSLVQHLAEIQLRRDRCARIETGLLDPNIGPVISSHSKPTINSAIADAFSQREASFMNLSRYESALSRDFDRTQKQLIAARKEKLAPTPLPDETKPKLIQKKEPEPARSIRTGEYIPAPDPEPKLISLTWIGPDGNELDFSRRDREQLTQLRR